MCENRTKFEFANLGGDLIPIGEITSNLDKISTDKKVLVLCRSGVRSAHVVEYLTRVTEQHHFLQYQGWDFSLVGFD